MSHLDSFEIFSYVAQCESITRAAQQLKITKASLSKRIKKLEDEYKIELFTRSKQRVKLTIEGEQLLKQCLKVREEMESARALCRQFHSDPEGVLYVVAFEYFARKLLFPRLKEFLDLYPNLELRIETTERVPNFFIEKADLALGFSLPVVNPGEVVQKRMATTRYVMCASPEYFAKYPYPIPKSLDDLTQHKYIEHASRTSSSLKLKKKYTLALRPYLVVNSVSSMIELALNHLGIVQLPLYMVEEYLHNGLLVEVLKDYQAENESVYYHYPKVRYMQSKVRCFIQYFLV